MRASCGRVRRNYIWSGWTFTRNMHVLHDHACYYYQLVWGSSLIDCRHEEWMERLNAASSTWWFVMTVYSGLCAYWNDASPKVPQWLDTPRSTKTTQTDTLAWHVPHVGEIPDLQSRGNVVEMFRGEPKDLKRVRSAEGNDHNCRTQTMLLRTSNEL